MGWSGVTLFLDGQSGMFVAEAIHGVRCYQEGILEMFLCTVQSKFVAIVKPEGYTIF